jgi:CRISPR/Cas system CSM-associated protein Csm2 small subunit
MAELNEVEQDVPPLLEVMLKELDIKDKWREIGEVLKVSKTKLDDIQGRGINDKEKFKIVLKEWLDKNMSVYMWSPLLQALNNSTIDMNPNRIEKLRKTYCNRTEGEYS